MLCSRRTTLALTILMMTAAASAQAAVLDVPGAWPDVASALAAARAGDVIELAPGTYAEHGLVVPTAVTIRGLGETASDVVLDGYGQGRILTCESVPGDVVLLNLTLRNGRAEGASSRLGSGGAVFASRTTLVARDCIFENNAADAHGGAVRLVGAGGHLAQCTFIGNTAVLGGGAVDCSYGSSPLIERTVFDGNTGGWGGALSCRGDSSPQVTRSLFLDNLASDLFGYGGGVFSDLESSPQVLLSTFHGNLAAYGGALGCFQGSRMNVDRCTLIGNAASGAGAGIYAIDGSPLVTGSIVAFHNGTGVHSVGLALPELGCSNVFGNSGADIAGPVTGIPGDDPLISADPQFCAPTSGGEMWTVAPGAPGVGSSCGVMGAWPATCSLEPATVATLDVAGSGSTTTVRWTSEGDHPGMQYRLVWTRAGSAERELLVSEAADGAFTGTAEGLPAGDDVLFRLYGRSGDEGWALLTDSSVVIEDPDPEVPAPLPPLALRNWPNPFNPETTIGVTVAKAARTRVEIYGLDGRRVRILADRTFEAGETELRWDGHDDDGRGLSSGTYVVRVSTADERRTHKITLVK